MFKPGCTVQEFRAAANAKALLEICMQPDAFANRSDRNMVVLIDRLQEDLLRSQWKELMEGNVAQEGHERVLDLVNFKVKRNGSGKRSHRRRRHD
jgi:hypothetical protein